MIRSQEECGSLSPFHAKERVCQAIDSTCLTSPISHVILVTRSYLLACSNPLSSGKSHPPPKQVAFLVAER